MGELGLDLGLLVSQAANFGILLILLYVFLYRPILGKLEERSKKIRQGVQDAEEAEDLLADTEARCDEKLTEARREARDIIDRATRTAEQQRQEILAQARQEAHEIILRAQQQAERQLREGQVALRQEVIDLSLAAAARLIGEQLEEDKHHELIEQFLSEVEQLE